MLNFIEEKPYNYTDLSSELSDEIIDYLAGIKVIDKTKKTSFKFTYVGFVSYKDTLLFVAPKLYTETDITPSTIKTVLKVLKLANKKIEDQSSNFLHSKKSKDYFGEIAVADFLIDDFVNHNGYQRYITTTALNTGSAENWKTTINTVIPFFSEGAPLYFDTYSDVSVEDTDSDIVRLYRKMMCYLIEKYALVLGYAIKPETKNKRIKGELFSSKNRKRYISIINEELSNTYKDKDVQALRAMKYLFDDNHFYNRKQLSLYGTIKFDRVWEECFKTIFLDEFEKYRYLLPLPVWQKCGGKPVSNERNLMETDIIHKFQDTLLIFDAKYYSLKLSDNSVVDNPGSYDIIKQYTYQLALENGGVANEYFNALLFPTTESLTSEYDIIGTVYLPLFNKKPILCIMYRMQDVFERYITGSIFTDTDFELFIERIKLYYEQTKSKPSEQYH